MNFCTPSGIRTHTVIHLKDVPPAIGLSVLEYARRDLNPQTLESESSDFTVFAHGRTCLYFINQQTLCQSLVEKLDTILDTNPLIVIMLLGLLRLRRLRSRTTRTNTLELAYHTGLVLSLLA